MVTELSLQDKLITLKGTCVVQRTPLNTPCPCDQKTHHLLLTEFTLCTEVTSGYPTRARKDQLGYIFPCWFKARGSGSMYSLEQNPDIVAFHMSQHLDVFSSCEYYVSCQFILTAWSRVLLEKIIGFQLVKKLPGFYGTHRFITAFTSARQMSLS
jgi:hypothetical protein